VAFHADYFEAMNGVALLREALQSRNIAKVFQLHEFGDPDYEVELGILEPGYRDGGESYSTSDRCDWVVYASHESSVTVCGDWLIQAFREKWPACDERTYKGPLFDRRPPRYLGHEIAVASEHSYGRRKFQLMRGGHEVSEESSKIVALGEPNPSFSNTWNFVKGEALL
jgi:hypothetical protein